MLRSSVRKSMRKPQYGKPIHHQVLVVEGTQKRRTDHLCPVCTADGCDLATRCMLERQESFRWRDESAIVREPMLHGGHESLGVIVLVGNEEKVIDVAK